MADLHRFVLLLLTLAVSASLVVDVNAKGVGCLDENGDPIDWWVIFKVPHLPSSSDPNAASGYGYAYADSSDQALLMTANRLDTNINGALGATLAQMYAGKGYVMYNDQTPDNKEHDSNGHTKGNMAFDSQGGFWLVHSVPRFPATGRSYQGYPVSETDYGQSFFCMSLDLQNLDWAASAFLLNKPYIYDYNMPSSMSSNMPYLATALNGQFIDEAAVNATLLKTLGGTALTAFSKTGAWGQDLYSEWVAPMLDSDLTIETWQNGAIPNKMPSFCRPKVKLDTVNVVEMAFNDQVAWKETQDHSKWAISVQSKHTVCIGDINRQYSQANRGGGTVCLTSAKLWSSINALVRTIESCSS